MPRRRVLLFGSVASVAALAFGLWALQAPPSAISVQNAAKIKKGMTVAEVEAILGGQARDESTGPTEVDGEGYGSVGEAGGWWASDYADICVTYDSDSDSRVEAVMWTPMRPRSQGVLDTIRRWLHL